MRTFLFRLAAVLLFAIVISCNGRENTAKKEEALVTEEVEITKTMFVGTYTKKEGHVDGQADGIIALKLDPETGEIRSKKTVAEVVNPSFVKVSQDGKFLFAVSELGSADAPNGYFYSFRILEDDSLEQISQLSTESFAPAHIALDQTGQYAFVSNYVGGVVMLYAIQEDGTLKKQQRIDLENPEESHPHSVTVSEDNKMVYVADLGNDKIWIFNFDAEAGSLTPHEQASIDLDQDSGPRHFTLSNDGKFAYSVNEVNSTVSVFEVLENGGLEELQNISTLPEGFKEKNSTADIHLHPSGKFLYASNRGHNSITAFEVDGTNGKLLAAGHFSTQGKTPRNFAISPSGNLLYVANQDSNTVVLYEVDEQTGELNVKGSPYQVMTPVCLEFY